MSIDTNIPNAPSTYTADIWSAPSSSGLAATSTKEYNQAIMDHLADQNIQNTIQDKTTLLQNKVQDKITALAGKWEPAMIESFPDADSPQIVGVTGGKGKGGNLTGQLTEDRDPGFDAYERAHPNDPYRNTNSAEMKYERQRQRLENDPEFAAKIGVKDQKHITDDDIARAGTWEQLMGLYNAIPGTKAAWEPGPLDYYDRNRGLELGSKSNPLNIPIERRDTGEIDYFGRHLAEIRNKDTGVTTRQALGYDGTEDAGYSAAKAKASLEAQGKLTPELAAYLDKNEKYTKQNRTNTTSARAKPIVDLTKELGLDIPDRSWGEAFSDTGKQAVVGSWNAVKNLADIYGIATGDHDNWVSHTAAVMAKGYSDSYSPALKAAAQHKGSEVAKGKDELEKFWIATKENFKNPMLISQLVVESAPMMAVALAGGEAMAAAKLGIGATEGMLVAGAVQQGADMGQSVIDSFFDPQKVTQKDWDNNPKYQEYIKQGMDPLAAKNKIAVDTGRVVALASGLLSYGVNKFMPGGHSIESKLTGGKVGGLVKSTAGESATEVVEEGGGQIFQNIGQQQVTPGLDTFANVGQVSADAMAAGGATNVAIQGLGTLIPGKKALSPEQKQALETPENTTVKAEDLQTGHTQEDIDNAMDIYHTTKDGGSIQDARDLVQAVDILETNKVKNNSTFKMHEAGKDRHEALGALLKYALREAYEGRDETNQVDMDSADEKFKDIIKSFNLSKRNKKALQDMLVAGVAYGTEGFADAAKAFQAGLGNMFSGFGKTEPAKEESLGMKDEIPATETKAGGLTNPFGNMKEVFKGFGDNKTEEDKAELDTLVKDKATTKTVVEKQVEQQAKKKPSRPTDEDLGVGTTVEDGYVKGISARTLNRLAGMFDLDVKDVRDSIAFAIPAMQVKKMDAVSKDAAKVQYETYYGKDGILPSYVGFKKAVSNGEVDEAVNHIDKVRQAGTRLERELIKHTRAVEELNKLVDNILGKLENGKISKEKAAVALDSLDVGVGKKYTLNAMDVAKDRIPEEVQALMDKRKESKVPEVIKAKQEALDMVDAILAHERISRDKPVYEKSYVADRVKDFEDRITETKKSIEEQKLEIQNAETREDKIVAKKVLAKLEKTLAEQEDTLNKYNTKYADVEYTWKEVFNRDKNKTTEEVKAKSGEQVGKVTKEQAEAMEAQGREVSEDSVAEKRNVTAAKDIAGKVAELAKLREDLGEVKAKANKKYSDVKSRIEKIAGSIGEEGSNLLEVQKQIANASDDLAKYKADKKRLEKELKKAVELEDTLTEAAIEAAEAYSSVADIENEATPKLVRALINRLSKVKDKVKITLLQVRRLIANRSAAQVIAELKKVTSAIEATQNRLKHLTIAGIAEARKNSSTPLSKAEATKVANAMKTINRLKRMIGWKVNKETGPNKILDRRDAEVRKVWNKIREIEASLYGTRLVESNRVAGKESIDRNGNEVSTEIGRMVKYVPTLFGHVPAYDLSELIPEEGGAKDLYKSTVLLAAGKMDKAIGNIKNDFTLADSPAMYYMRTANGKIDEQVAAVVALAAKEWAAATAKASIMNDNDTIARMIGKLDGVQVKPAERRLLKEGRLLVNEATSLGGKIVSALGIKEGDMPIGQYAQLKADFGNYGMSYLKAEGDIEFKTITPDAWNKVFEEKQVQKDVLLVKGIKSKVEYYESLRPKVRDINEALDLHDFAKDYRVTPIRTEGKVYEIENGYSQAPDHNQKILRKLESQKWSVADKAMDRLMEMDEDKVKEYMGWVNLSSMNGDEENPTHTKDAKEAQESINREIEENYEAVKSMYTKWKEGSIPKDVYFEWFFSKNGRYMLDSVGVNPQVDKQLARFLVVPKEATETIWNLKDKKDRLYFTSGIIQGLGIDLDGTTTEKLEKIGEDLLALDKEGVAKLVQGMLDNGEYELNGTKFKVSHIGHTLQALTALEEAVGNTIVKAVVTMEFDSKTSGFFHKLMQLPFKETEDQAKWLAKTGAYIDSNLVKFNEADIGTNDMMTTETDSYRTLTQESDTTLNKILNKEPKLKTAIDALKKAGAMPELVDENGKATADGRSLYKYPFMRFNYAESIQSNRRSMAHDLTNQVFDKIVAGEIPYDDHSREMYGMLGVTSTDTLLELRKKLATDGTDKVYMGKTNVTSTLEKVFNQTYGAALEEVMSKNFGHILEANKLMIAATQVMADAFIAELKKYDTTSGTQADLDKLIEKYAKVFPQIRAPFTNSRDNGIVIIDTKRAQGGNKWKADTQLPDGKTRTVQALIHEFEAAQAAGAVIPTHWTDGGVIGEVLRQGGVLGIHDAIALGYNGKQIEKMVKDMNRASYEVNRDFNIMQNMYTALVESLENVSDEALETIQNKGYNKANKEDAGMTIGQVVEAMRTETNMYNKRRADMYSKGVAVGNIIAYKDTVYHNSEELFGKVPDKVKLAIQNAVNEELMKCRGK